MIPIEISDIPASRLVTSDSRYRNQKVIYYSERRLVTFDTYLRKSYTFNGKEKIMVITKGYEYRPDLISQKVYGFPGNWWRIMEANNMKDIWDFKAGKTILLPDQVL